jgi:DNA-binding transcriptional ArsR family regulator
MELAETYAEVHRVLASRRRLMILWALEGRELSVSDIAHAIGASLQSTSQHLRLMRDHSMLSSRRDGQTVFYRLHQPDDLPFLISSFIPPEAARSSEPRTIERDKEDFHGR